MSVLFLYPDVGTYIMYLHAQIVKK
uniref:Uncharacterized protein n=1 Tax=Setaria italica TaxID=4555 RepID=A0A0Q3PRG6_SETIT